MKVNNKKICFIMCANSELQSQECIRYISQLQIPQGFSVDVKVIWDADSMTSGYNRAMRQSDAKYKVYLHQDVLLLHRGFLEDAISIFQEHSEIGMLGVVGSMGLAEDGCAWSDGCDNRIGELYVDLIDKAFHKVFKKVQEPYERVVVIDGLFMMTQYDIKWNEKDFKGWDFYDCSQSLEFWKAGYEVVVPYTEKPWCLHDNDILHMQDYTKWQVVFQRKYGRYYRNWNPELVQRGKKLLPVKPIIYQIFEPDKTVYSFPYPPLWEDEAEYICYTDCPEIHSKFWKINFEETLDADAIREKMSHYPMAKEIQTDEIQIKSLFEIGKGRQAIAKIPKLSELPQITFDLSKFVPTCDIDGNYVKQGVQEYVDGKYDGHPYLLTLGMPVSNQITTIDRCLSHVKPILDELDAELLIVDTGSTDGTIEVCKEYGARIIEFPWCNNMSAARNQGIYHARGEWYMSLDDDEWFEDVSEIIDFFKSGKYKNFDVASYVQRNYAYSDGSIYSDCFALRLAKLTPEIHFEGRIHDALKYPYEGSRGYQFSSYVHHYGFTMDDTNRKWEKYKRNVEGLLYDIWEYPEDIRFNYQLAQEFLYVKYHELAYLFCFKGLSLGKELDNFFWGRLHATMLMSAVYSSADPEYKYYYELIRNKYDFVPSELAYFSFICTELNYANKESADDMLTYIKDYWKYIKEYDRDPFPSRRLAFVGMDICDSPQRRMDAHVLGYVANSRLKKIIAARKELEQIHYDEIYCKQPEFLFALLTGDVELCEEGTKDFTQSQSELYMLDIMREYIHALEDIELKNTAFKNGATFLRKMSVQKLEIFLATGNFVLTDEAMVGYLDNIFLAEKEAMSLSELYFYSEIVKIQMFKEKNELEHRKLFFQYVELTARFAQGYYSKALLSKEMDSSVAGEVKAACEISYALEEGNSQIERIRHLKRAAVFFPGFKKEIQYLSEQVVQEKNVPAKNNLQPEMEQLAQQLKRNAVQLILAGNPREAEQILMDLKQFCPNDDGIDTLISRCVETSGNN